MQRLWLTKNGNYVDANGNIVGSKSKGLTQEARQYLQNKYKGDYANRTNANLLAGNIWDSQRQAWRANYEKSGMKKADWNTAVNWAAKNKKGVTKDSNGRFQFTIGNKKYYYNSPKQQKITQKTQKTQNNTFKGALNTGGLNWDFKPDGGHDWGAFFGLDDPKDAYRDMWLKNNPKAEQKTWYSYIPGTSDKWDIKPQYRNAFENSYKNWISKYYVKNTPANMTWYKDDNDYVPATIINGKKYIKLKESEGNYFDPVTNQWNDYHDNPIEGAFTYGKDNNGNPIGYVPGTDLDRKGGKLFINNKKIK